MIRWCRRDMEGLTIDVDVVKHINLDDDSVFEDNDNNIEEDDPYIDEDSECRYRILSLSICVRDP